MKRLAILLAFVSPTVLAETATVTWTHPTQRENGVALPLSEIRETRIDYGLCVAGAVPATPAGTVVVPAPATTGVVNNLTYGTWCFDGQTVDTESRTSVNSSVAQKIILAPPRPPVLNATITVAYEIVPDNWDGVRLGRNVGKIALGTECVGEAIDTNKGTYYEVPLDKVKLTKMPKSAIVVTKCEIS